MYSQGIKKPMRSRRYTQGSLSGCYGRYGTNGLHDATYNASSYVMRLPATPDEQRLALTAVRRYLGGDTSGLMGTYTSTGPGSPEMSVYGLNAYDIVVTHNYGQIPDNAALMIEPGSQINPNEWRSLISQSRLPAEFAWVSILQRKNQQKQQDQDCPPPENCTEKWIDKTLYVSAKPSADAIEIPVAFKKLVCEGESTEDPQVDCDELLRALQDSIGEGSVPGMMGLSQPNYPPDWCKDCEEKVVKASAYVTDSPTAGSKPFKVKVKVLVCETGAEPKVDCAEVVKALGEGMRKKKGRTISGLSEATATNRRPTSTGSGSATSGQEFDEEANKLDPSRQYSAKQAGFPWWMWLVLGGTVAYAARKL